MSDEPGFRPETYSTYEPTPEEIAARRAQPTGRPSSQELADRVREPLTDLRGDYNHCRWCPLGADSVCFPNCAVEKMANEALDALAARLQTTEQALDAIETELGTLPLDHLGPATERSVSKAWAMAREKRPDPELVPRALEGAAE